MRYFSSVLVAALLITFCSCPVLAQQANDKDGQAGSIGDSPSVQTPPELPSDYIFIALYRSGETEINGEHVSLANFGARLNSIAKQQDGELWFRYASESGVSQARMNSIQKRLKSAAEALGKKGRSYNYGGASGFENIPSRKAFRDSINKRLREMYRKTNQ